MIQSLQCPEEGRYDGRAKGAKTAYINTKHVAKHAIWLAKSEAEEEVFATIYPDGDGVFHIAKQMDRTNQDVVSENCVHNDAVQLVLTPAHSMHLMILTCYIKACEWEMPNEICIFRLNGAYSDQKNIIAERLKAAGEEGVELARQLIEAVFSSSVITSDWEGSFILNLYKGKGEALGHGNYRDLKLTDQVMKLHKQVLDSYIREMVNINEMQLGFVPGRGTTGTIFVVRQLQEKYIAANKLHYFAFADPQKAFDHVSRKVLWRALNTETEMSSFWQNFHQWLHLKLSKWQLPVQSVMKISSKWRHFRFSVKEPRGCGIGCACHSSHVLQCPESYAGQ